MKVTGWGRFPRIDTEIVAMRSPEEGRAIVPDRPSLITRGNGRVYGDAVGTAVGILGFQRLLVAVTDCGEAQQRRLHHQWLASNVNAARWGNPP